MIPSTWWQVTTVFQNHSMHTVGIWLPAPVVTPFQSLMPGAQTERKPDRPPAYARGNNSHRRLERHLSKESLFGFLSSLTKSNPVQSSVAQLGLRGATTYETTSLLLVQLKPLVSAHDSKRWVWLMAQQPQLVAEGVTPGTYRDLNASPAFHATEPAPPDQLSFCWGGQRGERPTLAVLKAPTYALSERCSMMFLCLARTQGTGVVVLILHRMKRYFELPGGGGGGRGGLQPWPLRRRPIRADPCCRSR